MGRTRAPHQFSNCAVCGLAGHGNNFGVFSCLACAAFFRKSVVEGREYECKRQQNCVIWEDSRNTCRHCRLKKCLQMRMNKNLVQNQYTKCAINEQMKKKKATAQINKTQQAIRKRANTNKKNENSSIRRNKTGTINATVSPMKMPQSLAAQEDDDGTTVDAIDVEENDDDDVSYCSSNSDNDENDHYENNDQRDTEEKEEKEEEEMNNKSFKSNRMDAANDKPEQKQPPPIPMMLLLRSIECRLRQLRANKGWIKSLELAGNAQTPVDGVGFGANKEKPQQSVADMLIVPELDRLLLLGRGKNFLARGEENAKLFNEECPNAEAGAADFWHAERILCLAVFKSMPWYDQMSDGDKRNLLAHVERQVAVLTSMYYTVEEEQNQQQLVWFSGKSLQQTLLRESSRNEMFKGLSYRLEESIAKLHVQLSKCRLSGDEFALLLALIFTQHTGINLVESGRKLLLEEATKLHKFLYQIFTQKYGKHQYPVAQMELMTLMMSSHEIGIRQEQLEILIDLYQLKGAPTATTIDPVAMQQQNVNELLLLPQQHQQQQGEEVHGRNVQCVAVDVGHHECMVWWEDNEKQQHSNNIKNNRIDNNNNRIDNNNMTMINSRQIYVDAGGWLSSLTPQPTQIVYNTQQQQQQQQPNWVLWPQPAQNEMMLAMETTATRTPTPTTQTNCWYISSAAAVVAAASSSAPVDAMLIGKDSGSAATIGGLPSPSQPPQPQQQATEENWMTTASPAVVAECYWAEYLTNFD